MKGRSMKDQRDQMPKARGDSQRDYRVLVGQFLQKTLCNPHGSRVLKKCAVDSATNFSVSRVPTRVLSRALPLACHNQFVDQLEGDLF